MSGEPTVPPDVLAYESGRAFERVAIQDHLRRVVTDHARGGNDEILGALLDAIRELHRA